MLLRDKAHTKTVFPTALRAVERWETLRVYLQSAESIELLTNAHEIEKRKADLEMEQADPCVVVA